MAKAGNWAVENCNTIGAGNLVLTGANPGFSKFRDALPAGLVWYSIEDGSNREAGIGTFDGTSSLVRTTIHATLFNGVFNDVAPSPISLSGDSLVGCTFNTTAYNELLAHLSLTNNPHNVVATQVAYDPSADPITAEILVQPAMSAHGVAINANAADLAAHEGVATIHFLQGAIDHAVILNRGTVSHADLDTHVGDATIHFTQTEIDHVNILNKGVQTHAQIDTHIGDATIHFTEASIVHQSISGAGTNDHAAIDAHIAATANPHGTTIANLGDTTIGVLANGHVLVWNTDHWENVPNTAATTFIGLSDTPIDYSGARGQYLQVDPASDNIIFTPSAGGGTGSSEYDYTFQGNGVGDPLSGNVGTNNAGLTLVTELRISHIDGNLDDREAGLYTLSPGDLIQMNSGVDSDFATYEVATAAVNQTTYAQIAVVYHNSTGDLGVGEAVKITVVFVPVKNFIGLFDTPATYTGNDTKLLKVVGDVLEFVDATHAASLTDGGTNTHAQIDTHIADGTIHYAQSAIDHTVIANRGVQTHAQIDTHIGEGTIHFTQAEIDHVNILNKGTNTHAQIDAHIGDATLHFTVGSISHTAIADIGTNAHTVIDTHIDSSPTIHFTQAQIDHVNILNKGTNTHAQIDTHLGDATVHFTQAAIDHTAILNRGSVTHADLDIHVGIVAGNPHGTSAADVGAEAIDATILRSGATSNLTVGFTTDIDAIGNTGVGTVDPNLLTEFQKTLTIDGTFTLATPVTGNGYCEIVATNDAIGDHAITVTGYTVLSGAYVATANAVNLFRISKVGAVSYLEIINVS